MGKLTSLWWEFKAWHDNMQWQNSPERRELAVVRLARYRAFLHQPHGGTLTNPYTDPNYEPF